MIRRSTREGEPERDVDALLKGERLERNQRLLMIHEDRRVVTGARGTMNHGVGRMRPGHVEILAASRLDRGLDDVDLLAAKASLLSGMGIEPAHRKPRPRDAKKPTEIACRGLD